MASSQLDNWKCCRIMDRHGQKSLLFSNYPLQEIFNISILFNHDTCELAPIGNFSVGAGRKNNKRNGLKTIDLILYIQLYLTFTLPITRN